MRALYFTGSDRYAESLRELLRREGYQSGVIELSRVPAGFEAVPPCDVIIFDCDLPGLAPQAVARLKASAPGLRVVLLLGWWDAREAEFRGTVDFVLNAPLRPWQVREMTLALGLGTGRAA